MKTIAIITSGLLPVPAVHGGAVENLIEFLIDYNELHPTHHFILYTKADPSFTSTYLSKYKYTRFIQIYTESLLYRVKQTIRRSYKWKYYSNVYWDYFLKQCINDLKKRTVDDILIENRAEFVLPVYKELGIKPIVHLHIKYRLEETIPEIAIASIKYAKSYIAVSEWVKNTVLEVYPQGNVIHIHNGIQLDKFNRISKAEARKEFKLSDDDFILSYAGRIVDIKGIRELIIGMHSLKDIPNLKLLVAGNSFSGKGHKSLFMQNLIEQAKELDDRIIFTGYIPYDKIPTLLSASDVALVPTIKDEAFALSCTEAMASGIPLITTYSGGIPETSVGCARILQPDKKTLPKELARNIRELYESPEICKCMSELGLERSKKFGHEIYAKKILDALL